MSPHAASKPIISVLSITSAALLFATGGIHLDLYLTGYRQIPTIGPLFIVQIASAFVLAFAVLIVRSPVVSLSGAAFALSTLGGYILSRAFGLFGFHEVRTSAGIVAGLIEIAAFAVLGALTLSVTGVSTTAPIKSRSTSIRSTPITDIANHLRPWFRLGVAPLVLVSIALLFSAEYAASNGTGPTTASSSSTSSTKSSNGPRIIIKNFAFIPADITVHPGEKITVTNDDSVAHTVTAMPGSSPMGTFNTGDVNPSATTTFSAPLHDGTYRYFCSIHNFMTGVVTVSG